MSRLVVTILILSHLCAFTLPQQNPFKFGAVFRRQEDAHLIAAFNYSIKWVNKHLKLPVQGGGQFEHAMEILKQPQDHYGLILKACKLFEEHKVMAVFGPADPKLSSQLMRLTDTLDVPLFTVSDDFSYHKLDSMSAGQYQRKAGQKQYQSTSRINIFPQAQLMEAISDLIMHWRWNRVIVVYVDVDRIKRLIPFLEDKQFFGIRFYFVRVENEDFLKSAMKIKTLEDCANIHQRECSEYSRILVDMNPKDSYNFLLAVS